MSVDNLLFIMGPTRSGSKIYQNALNKINGVTVFDTLHFLRPIWVGKDFVRISKSFGSLTKDKNLLKLIELIYSKKLITTPSGSFWSSDVFDSINKDALITRFKGSIRESTILLDILLSEIKKIKNINLLGFRGPVHIAYTELLRKWYPSSKILFIIRDPRAVYISTIKKNLLSSSAPFARIIMYIKRFIYVIILFKMSMRKNEVFIKDKNYKLIRFEDLLDDDVGIFQDICDFINLPFNKKMLDIPQVDSSYAATGTVNQVQGINKELANKWMEYMHPLVDHLFKMILKKEMKYFGYLM